MTVRPIRRLLIPNRGEIARRICRTAREMGMSTVVVHAASDGGEPFVAEADVAVALTGSGPTETYLDTAQILAAAAATGADAVHPGYGFASERADFATAVIDAGLIWVGPPPDAMVAMADKVTAKARMAAAGVPVLASVEVGADGAVDGGAVAALRFPVLVKAAAGGGGRGMRVVDSPADLAGAVASAQREAGAAFGDPRVFIERYLTEARHIEIQVLADAHGGVVHVFERECSVQRRHQKIIEESPSPALDDARRRAMTDAAVTAARAVGYVNAGTVEFVAGPEGDFFFLEVNTRLQVEHPVTEAVTGLDLVREQLRVAEGHPLAFAQEDLARRGHAVEARLYAEDPAAGFLPATGTVVEWRPDTTLGVRYDSGIETGSVIGVDWDPMLAKVVAHAPTRTEAALRLALALERTVVRGVTTNRDYLVAALRHPRFLGGDTTTAFVDGTDVPRRRVLDDEQRRVAVVAATLTGAAGRRAEAPVLASLPSGWRNSVMPTSRAVWTDGGGEQVPVGYRSRRDGTFDVTVEGPAPWSGPAALVAGGVVVGGVRHRADVGRSGPSVWVMTDAGDVALREVPRFGDAADEVVAGGLTAPMPGRVTRVEVGAGDRVAAGALLAVVEAMKMEHRVLAPRPGTVAEVRVAVGDQVGGGDLLAVIDEDAGPDRAPV